MVGSTMSGSRWVLMVALLMLTAGLAGCAGEDAGSRDGDPAQDGSEGAHSGKDFGGGETGSDGTDGDRELGDGLGEGDGSDVPGDTDGCPKRTGSAEPETLETIEQATTWTFHPDRRVDYRATGPNLLLEAAVTVEPCVVIELDTTRVLVKRAGQLQANGEPDRPVTFTGVRESPGTWGGLDLEIGQGSDNRLVYTVIEHAGTSDFADERPAVRLEAAAEDSPLTLHNVTIRDSAGVGLETPRFPEAIFTASDMLDLDANAYLRNAGGGVRVGANVAEALSPSSTWSRNGGPPVGLYPQDLVGDHTWEDLGVPYRVLPLRNVLLLKSATLELGPGTVLEMSAGQRILSEGAPASSAFTARGTANDPVKIRGAEGTPGAWQGVVVGESTGNFVLEHAIVEGAVTNVHLIDGPHGPLNVTIEHTTLRDASEHGLSLTYDGHPVEPIGEAPLNADWSANTYTGNGAFPVFVWSNLVQALTDIDSSMTGNARDFIHVRSGGFAQGDVTFHELDVPYLLSYNEKSEGALVIDSGTELVFREHPTGDDATLKISGDALLEAQGTQQTPIEMRSLTAEPGSWKGLIVRDDARAVLEHVTLKHGGIDRDTIRSPGWYEDEGEAGETTNDPYGGNLLIIGDEAEVTWRQGSSLDSALQGIWLGGSCDQLTLEEVRYDGFDNTVENGEGCYPQENL